MAVVSKKRLALSLGIDRTTIDGWIARYPNEFPVVARGGAGSIAWQFDLEKVREFIALKRQQRDRALAARRANIEALRNRFSDLG